MPKVDITLNINGETYAMNVAADRALLDVLRQDLGLTGTKTNCLEAECGVCTVLIDGKAVNSCTTLAAQCRNKQITTIEERLDREAHHVFGQAGHADEPGLELFELFVEMAEAHPKRPVM